MNKRYYKQCSVKSLILYLAKSKLLSHPYPLLTELNSGGV